MLKGMQGKTMQRKTRRTATVGQSGEQDGTECAIRSALTLAISLALVPLSLAGNGPGRGVAELELSSLDGNTGFVLIGEGPYDQAGTSVSAVGDFNIDGIDDLVIGAPYAGPSNNESGRSYVVFGSADGFPASVDLGSLNGGDGLVLNGEQAGDLSGSSVDRAGDINGDGIDDLLIGAPYADANGTDSGRSYVVFGVSDQQNATLDLASLDGDNGFAINGENALDQFGWSVGPAGDLNGDGIDDVVIGAVGADSNGDYSGRAYVIFGSDSGFTHPFELANLNSKNGFIINGESASDQAGASVGVAGDVNGDGLDDLLIGAFGASPNGDDSGRTYVLFGSQTPFPPVLELSSLNGANGFTINGEAEFDRLGQSVSDAGDFNGDGTDDLIVGARLADPNGGSSGRAYVVFGNNSFPSSPIEISDLNGQNGLILNGEAQGDAAGGAVGLAGDFNHDGIDDIIIGAEFADPNGDRSGRSYLVFGTTNPSENPLELSDLDGSNGLIINGVAGEDRSGSAVSSAGDINGDGAVDLLIGASEADGSGIFSGRSYVIFGRRDDVFADRFD
jgi:hypothetical protein